MRPSRATPHDPQADATARMEAMMARYLGPAIVAAFEDDDVTEIYTNPHDTVLRLDTRSRGRVATERRISPERVVMFLDSVAMHVGAILGSDHPCLQAELPAGRFRKARLQGFLPPVTQGPTFTIRKPPRVVYSLDDYVNAGALGSLHRDVLRAAVCSHGNILVVGGTNTGKTTFANALLREIAEETPGERVVILEDTVELQCLSPDHLALRSQPGVSLADLVKATMRTSPDRIVVGEVRDAAALDLLDAWATGHPGGVATFHATDADGALHRLDRLAQRANVPCQAHLVAEAVDLIVMLDYVGGQRRVVDLVKVWGLDASGRYHLEPLGPGLGAAPTSAKED